MNEHAKKMDDLVRQIHESWAEYLGRHEEIERKCEEALQKLEIAIESLSSERPTQK